MLSTENWNSKQSLTHSLQNQGQRDLYINVLSKHCKIWFTNTIYSLDSQKEKNKQKYYWVAGINAKTEKLQYKHKDRARSQ